MVVVVMRLLWRGINVHRVILIVIIAAFRILIITLIIGGVITGSASEVVIAFICEVVITFVIVGPDRTPLPVNERDFRYVSTADRGSLRNGLPFWFETQPGELMLAFTDGVNECHYRQPATSVSFDDIADTAAYHSYEPLPSVEAIAQLALEGVRGNPGGEDNLAIIAARV